MVGTLNPVLVVLRTGIHRCESALDTGHKNFVVQDCVLLL